VSSEAASRPASAGRSTPQFVPRSSVHTRAPWEPYAYFNRTLPVRLHALARELRVPSRAQVLDYGCASVPYRYFFPEDVNYAGADFPGNPDASLQLNPDGTVPADDSSFDVVVSTQVLEHVAEPRLHLSECFRVLRPGGQLLLSTHGVFVYHPDPADYWRWTSAGLRREIEQAGFEVTRFEGVFGLAATGLQLVQHAIWVRLPRPLRAPLALCMQALVAVADRLQSQESRDADAAVFALIATKPRAGSGYRSAGR
jgi:SAM-dependent methyltransferase